MTLTGYRIARIGPDDLTAVASVRRRVWPAPQALTERYLRWKYFDNPYLAEPLVWIALRGDEPVAIRAMMGTAWNVPGLDHPVVIPQAADTVIVEEHRDRGLHVALNEQAISDLEELGYSHAINMSASPANYMASIMQLGWKHVARYEPLRRSNESRRSSSRRDRLMARLRPSTSSPIPIQRLDRAAAALARRGVDIVSEPPHRVMSEPDRSASDRIRPVRDEDFWTWRHRNPMATYRFLSSDKAGLVVGAGRTGERLSIVDWVGGDAPVGLLAEQLVGELPLVEIETWGAAMGSELRDQFERLGFAPWPTKRRTGMLVRRLGEATWTLGDADVSDVQCWDLRPIMSDRF